MYCLDEAQSIKQQNDLSCPTSQHMPPALEDRKTADDRYVVMVELGGLCCRDEGKLVVTMVYFRWKTSEADTILSHHLR